VTLTTRDLERIDAVFPKGRRGGGQIHGGRNGDCESVVGSGVRGSGGRGSDVMRVQSARVRRRRSRGRPFARTGYHSTTRASTSSLHAHPARPHRPPRRF
jgi:hypothetical protein